MAARLRLCRHHLHWTDAAGYCAAAWYSVAVQLGRGRAYPAGLAGVYGHLYAAVLADCHQLFLHACDPLSADMLYEEREDAILPLSGGPAS